MRFVWLVLVGFISSCYEEKTLYRSNTVFHANDCLFTDGMFLPPQMLAGYGDFLYQTGMIDELQKQYVDKQTDFAVQLIQQQKWVEAFKVSHIQNVALEELVNKLRTPFFFPPMASGF